MIKKRWLVIFSLALVFTIFFILSISLVSAQNWGLDLRQGSQQIIDWVVEIFEPFLQAILGGQDYTGMLVFERLLVFLLLLAVVYVSLSKVKLFEDYPFALWIIAIIVPLISIRYMDFEWLNTILMSYRILGIAMLGIVPLVIYTLFLHNFTDSSVLRKIGWAFFIVIYLGLWLSDKDNSYAYIYFWTMIASLILLLLDGTIRRYLDKQERKELDKDNKKDYERDLRRQVDKLRDDLKNNVITESEYNHIYRKLKKRLKALDKEYYS